MVTKSFVFSMVTIILQMKIFLKLITWVVQSSSPGRKIAPPPIIPLKSSLPKQSVQHGIMPLKRGQRVKTVHPTFQTFCS